MRRMAENKSVRNLALPQEQEVEVMGTLTQIFAYPQDLLRSVPDMGGTSIQVVEE